MLDGAVYHKINPRELSFKETLQLINNFRILFLIAPANKKRDLYQLILISLKGRVHNRPGRIEPRLIRHNKNKYDLLKKSREETRKGFWKRGWAWEQRKKARNSMAKVSAIR